MTLLQHPANGRSRYTVVPRVLIFAQCEDQMLLLKGAPTKPLWPDTYNGVGGHVEPGETIIQAAARELAEETGIHTTNLTLCGMVSISLSDSADDILLFVFSCRVASFATHSSVEGTLEWFPWDNLPSDHIMPDLPVLLPRVREAADTRQPFYALYTYDANGSLHIAFTN